MNEAKIKVPLQVSTVDLANATPLAIHGCTEILSRLDREVRSTPCIFTFPQNEKRKIRTSKSN
jgi:hypothetical protein